MANRLLRTAVDNVHLQLLHDAQTRVLPGKRPLRSFAVNGDQRDVHEDRGQHVFRDQADGDRHAREQQTAAATVQVRGKHKWARVGRGEPSIGAARRRLSAAHRARQLPQAVAAAGQTGLHVGELRLHVRAEREHVLRGDTLRCSVLRALARVHRYQHGLNGAESMLPSWKRFALGVRVETFQ